MQDAPPFKDFYDRSVIPVGEKDRTILGRSHHGEGGVYEAVTHWLIALIWYEDDTAEGWKVSVYPVCRNKPFWLVAPFYESNSLYSFDIALKLSRILEEHSQKDMLTARLFYQELRKLDVSPIRVSLNYENLS
ncbi:hypothetical protein ACFO25_14270 [Paenactinomyces guangxiensis]|uniref:Uncharacterized protein n=1 Tax=Paenactinomyces guangxiensis TaxID=1490290 RepID=A0A7W2A8A5_9BACL|nr:hypothetical protein [Paenactinomyces guangxiensis]MBA4493969.1 hypothetical protein [Paenactinomyces guangxiensis]MBH8593390.1 hypothetical protein [Paenactinomyces guangxiensis]